MKKYYDYTIFKKNAKNKYEKVNNEKQEGIYLLMDLASYHERKIAGEKMRIVKHYNYHKVMDITVYFNNGYKYVFYDVPCTSGAYIDWQELSK